MNFCVVGMCYGDEGKGSIVDFLTRQLQSKLTVRFSGGPQSSHHVVLPDGRWHGFAQWGAGTFAGARTYLSQYMMIDLYALQNEAHRLQTECGIDDPWKLITIHPDCRVITPWHWKMNRLRESSRGANRHGSCGMGLGEVRQDEADGYEPLRLRDLGNINKTLSKLVDIRNRKILQAEKLAGLDGMRTVDEAVAEVAATLWQVRSILLDRGAIEELPLNEDSIVFEGSQGLMLDEALGVQPHTTWSDVTSNNARLLSTARDLHVIGVVPSIWSRHGAGNLSLESAALKSKVDPTNHNKFNDWQGKVRYGFFDYDSLFNILKRARKRANIDSLAMTKIDLDDSAMTHIEDCKQCRSTLPPVLIKSKGQTYLDKEIMTAEMSQTV